MPDSRRILVTGAAGLAGRAVVGALVERGETVVVLRHRSPLPDGAAAGAGVGDGAGVVVVDGDLLEPESLEAAVRGCAAVVHAAALQTGDEAALRAVNVEGTAALARAAAAAGARRFVLLGSASIYAPGPMTEATEEHPVAPPDAYARSKRDAEEAAHAILGARAVTLRCPSIYSSGPCPIAATAAALLSAPALPRVEDGAGRLDLLHVDDLARAVRRALATSDAEGPFNLAGPASIAFDELVDGLADALGLSPPWVPVASDDVASDDGRFDPALLEWARVPRSLSIARARSVLGYAPRREWREALPEAVRAVAG